MGIDWRARTAPVSSPRNFMLPRETLTILPLHLAGRIRSSFHAGPSPRPFPHWIH